MYCQSSTNSDLLLFIAYIFCVKSNALFLWFDFLNDVNNVDLNLASLNVIDLTDQDRDCISSTVVKKTNLY